MRRLLPILAAIVATLALAASLGSTAMAAPAGDCPAPNPTLAPTQPRFSLGTLAEVRGEGFPCDEAIRLTWRGSTGGEAVPAAFGEHTVISSGAGSL